MAELTRDRIDWKSHCKDLSTPERLRPFNPIIEQLSGVPALDASRVHLVDNETLKRKCSARFVNGCFVTSGARIYIDKSLAWRRVGKFGPFDGSRTSDGFLNPGLIEGTAILTTYAHEQAHSMDRRLSPSPVGAAFDEMEAYAFALLFSKTFAGKYEKNYGADVFYAELGAFFSRITLTLNKVGEFRSMGQLVRGYEAMVLGTERGEVRDYLKEGAPHNIASVAFAILIKEFDYDLKALYGFLHSRSDTEVQTMVDKALGGYKDVKQGIRANLAAFKERCEQDLPSNDARCNEPSNLSYNCSAVNPARSAVDADPESFHLFREKDVSKMLEIARTRKDLVERFVESLKGAAEDLEKAINGSPWRFKCDDLVCNGRNDDLFVTIIGNQFGDVHLLHRKRDSRKLDIWFENGVSRNGTVILRQNEIDGFYGYTRVTMVLNLPKDEDAFESRFMLISVNREDGQSTYDRVSHPEMQALDHQKFKRLIDLVVSLARKK